MAPRRSRLCERPCVIRHGAVLARHAELRVTREVDEGAEDGEHLVVLGRRGAHAQRARLAPRDGAVRLEDGLDHAAVDAAVVVDVVDERAVGVFLVDADLVDEVLDAVEVDERDRDLDRVLAHAGAELPRCGFRDRRAGRRRSGRPRRAVVVATTARAEHEGADHRDHEQTSHGHPPAVHSVDDASAPCVASR